MTIVLLRITKKIRKPYCDIVKNIFILGLIFVALSMVANVIENIALAKMLDEVGILLITCGFIIILWESFKEGLEEGSRRGSA